MMEDRLDWQQIAKHLGSIQDRLQCHVVTESISSTNDWPAWGCGQQALPAICLARQQTAGRGRNGRCWVSAANENIYMSLVWSFAKDRCASLAGLSLVIGIAMARVIRAMGIEARLKWPNDVQVQGRKLAGILIESKIRQDAMIAIIGVGLNYALSDASRGSIDQPCVDVTELVDSPQRPDRNELAANMIRELFNVCDEFEQSGLGGFMTEWRNYDACLDHLVEVRDAAASWIGKAVGLDEQGGLRVLRDGREQVVYAGEVSVRIK